MQVAADHERDPERHSCTDSDSLGWQGYPIRHVTVASSQSKRQTALDLRVGEQPISTPRMELHTSWITGMIHSVGWLSRAHRFRNAGSSERLD